MDSWMINQDYHEDVNEGEARAWTGDGTIPVTFSITPACC